MCLPMCCAISFGVPPLHNWHPTWQRRDINSSSWRTKTFSSEIPFMEFACVNSQLTSCTRALQVNLPSFSTEKTCQPLQLVSTPQAGVRRLFGWDHVYEPSLPEMPLDFLHPDSWNLLTLCRLSADSLLTLTWESNRLPPGLLESAHSRST